MFLTAVYLYQVVYVSLIFITKPFFKLTGIKQKEMKISREAFLNLDVPLRSKLFSDLINRAIRLHSVLYMLLHVLSDFTQG